jgi:4-hydroxy-tetrahydrodipicolinate reductase
MGIDPRFFERASRMITLAINGAAGRMGRRLVALAAEDPQFRVAAALEQPGHPLLGQDAGAAAGVGPLSLPFRTAPEGPVDVFIDFTVPLAMRQALRWCTQTGSAAVIGTTGLTAEDHAALDEAARSIALLQAPNMSLGVNLLMSLAAQAARQLGDDYDIEISETHHRFKKDAPSGTALGLAQAICAATGKDPAKDLAYDRHGSDVPRKRGEIGMHALRLGDVVGDHTVSFGAPGERIELTHVATNRDVFVRGALRAAGWLAGKPAGRYRIADVLGL